MKFTTENFRDIDRYFNNTWMKLPVDLEAGHTDSDTIVNIQRVTRTEVVGFGPDNTRFVIHLSDDPALAFDVDYIMPHKSYFEYSGKACLLLRVPARQYKRGVCSDNVHVLAVNSIGNFEKLMLTAQLLQAYTKKPAFGNITHFSQKTSTPLSPRFCVSMDGRIFVDTTRIAKADAASKTVYTRHRLFKKELEALVVPYGWKVVVSATKAPAVHCASANIV